jgi:hypothetical protein
MSEPTLTREQAWGWEETMVVAAVRHCLATRSGFVLDCTDWLVDYAWSELSERNRELIRRDVEAAFADGQWTPMDWAEQRWNKVRGLWTQKEKAGE